MARTVGTGQFQRMQRMQRVATTASASDQADSPPPTLTVPEQLAALEIHATPGSAYGDVVKRIRARCSLLDIPAIDEEIAAEALRRCGMLPEPTAEVHMLAGLVLQDDISGMPLGQVVGLVRLAASAAHLSPTESEVRDEADRRWQAAQPEPTVEDAIAAAEGLPLLADAPDEVIMSLGQDDPAGDGPRDEEIRAIWAEKHARGLHDGVVIPDCPECSAVDAPVEPKLEDRAEADEPTPDAMTRLVAREMPLLDVGAHCTAEMSLHMITERVRDDVLKTDWGKLATDAEIVAEAERIWATFSDNRRGPREVTLNADGTVRDWRRPDNTPDRGPDVGTTHHTVSDETRFSGAGEGQADDRSQLVPNDSDFLGKPFLESSKLAMLAGDLIEKHGYLGHLEQCVIRYWWERKTGSVDRQRVVGSIKRGSGHYGQLLGADFSIFLAADTARDGNHTDRRVERSLFRQLRQIGQDDKGNWIKLPYSLKLFPEEIQEYADLDDADLKVGRNAYRGAEQMGLFREEPEPVSDDGAGVLIHDDGTPLSADEIAEMEEAELHGEEEDDEDSDPNELQPYDDEPADPDGPAPDEDPLADVDL